MNEWLQFGLPEYVPPGTCFFGTEVLAIATLAATAIGTGVSAIGSMQQAQASSDAAKYQQQVAKNNQQIAEQNAAETRQTAQTEAEAQGLKNAAVVGAEVAGQGAAGIDPTTGSPADVVAGTRAFQRLDLLNLMQGRELTARGQQQQGAGFAASADLLGMQAANAQTAGLYKTGSSILGGVSSIGSKWLDYTKPGGVFA